MPVAVAVFIVLAAVAPLTRAQIETFTFDLGATSSVEGGKVPLVNRSVIERLSIDREGIVTVRYVTHGDDDPACCPTMKIEDRYRVEQGKLIGITK